MKLRAPEYIVMFLILMVTCSTYYLHWTHGPEIHDHEKYRVRKSQLRSVCHIEADCSIYSTCVSGKCLAFWPAIRSNITCRCLNDIINYEDHFYLKTVSSVLYHKGPTSKTCVVSYRWGSHQQSGAGSSVEEYEKHTTGAFLRRESILDNTFVALCKRATILKTPDEPEATTVEVSDVKTPDEPEVTTVEVSDVKILYSGTSFTGNFNRIYKVSTLEDTKTALP